MARAALLVLLVFCANAVAGPLGQPVTQRFMPTETGAQPYSFAVLPLPSGEVFVANLDGVSRYFGQRWQSIDVGGAARSLAAGPGGSLYVGGYQTFGQLKRDREGRFHFHRLDKLFVPDDAGAPLGEVWDTVVADGGVYFATRTAIFFYADDGQHRRIDVPAGLVTLIADEDGPIAVLRDDRIMRIRNAGLVDWLRAPFEVASVQRQDAGYRVFGERGDIYAVDGDALRRIDNPLSAVLRSATVYTAKRLPDGDYAIGTLAGTLYRLAPDLRRYSVLATATAPVLSLAVDTENGLWAATEAGLLRVNLDLAWTEIDAGNGLIGPPTHAAEWNGRLYVSTSLGLFATTDSTRETANFERIGFADTEVHYLWPSALGLLICARTGVFLLDATGLRTIVDDVIAWRLFPSARYPGRYYAIEDAGLIVLDTIDDRLVESQRFLDAAYKFDELVETDGSILVDRVLAVPMRFPIDSTGRLGPPLPATTTIEALNGTLASDDAGVYVSTDDALLRLSATGETVELADHPWISAGLAPSDELRARRCPDGTQLAMTHRALLVRRPGADWKPLYPMNGRTLGVHEIACAGDVLLVTTWSSLARFDPAHATELAPLAPPVLERVETIAPRGRLSLGPLVEPIALPAGHRLRVHFASPYLGGAVRYQSRLASIERSWVDAGQGFRDLTLAAGQHQLLTRAIDSAGRISATTPLSIAVSRDWQALIVNALIAILGIALASTGIYAWRTRSLRRINQELQSMVAERTHALAQRGAELEAANQRLVALADMDGLTGVANRRKLEAELDRAWREALASQAPLSLLMIDVDHFKRFNDTHGHLLGDERLQAIAERLKGWVAPGDTLARYGGEEFVLVMPGATLAIAAERAQAIGRDTRAVDRLGDSSTVSIGVAERTASHAETPEQLFEFADLALYRAKNAGRDRVELYDPS